MRLTSAGRSSFFRVRSGLSSTAAVTVAAVLLLAIFELDRETGSAPVQHLYYLPILFAGVRFRMRGGVLAALTAIVSYHLANPHLLTFRYEESDLVPMILFVVAGVVSAKLTNDAERLHRLAMTDDLTGLHNLRSFEGLLAAMVRSSRETGLPLAMLVLDVDRLKVLNDAHGHRTGAEAVQAVGHLIGAGVPAGAVACRFGGDEFVVAIPACTRHQAAQLADRIRAAVNASAPTLAGVAFPVGTLSVSIGLACRTFAADIAGHGDEAGEGLFQAADEALYLAKRSGRNHVSVA